MEKMRGLNIPALALVIIGWVLEDGIGGLSGKVVNSEAELGDDIW